MKPVTRIEGTMAPLPRANVDTDQIIPKQFLKRVERTGYGEFLFWDWRQAESESPFVLNRPEFSSAKILVTGANFGSGSSREHAPWGLQDWGFEAIVAPTFADIFYNNCTKIGLLPVALAEKDVLYLTDLAEAGPAATATIDLEDQSVEAEGFSASFTIQPFIKWRLLNGLDDIGLTLRHGAAIAEFERGRPSFLPSTRG